MKTSELTGLALDWMVAKCEDEEMAIAMRECSTVFDGYHYSTDWAQGGPIIEREKIAVLPCPRGWSARIGYCGNYVEGATPLIAAMRCYCCAKLGDEIDIPQELQPCQQPNL